MWPFKKRDDRPRVLMIDAWRHDGAADMRLRRVSRIGEYFAFTKYDFESDLFILLPGGKVRGSEKLTWEKIDDIPGLTDVDPAPTKGE